MSDLDALLAGLAQSPHDAAAHAAVADWLQEHPEQIVEFVRRYALALVERPAAPEPHPMPMVEPVQWTVPEPIRWTVPVEWRWGHDTRTYGLPSTWTYRANTGQ